MFDFLGHILTAAIEFLEYFLAPQKYFYLFISSIPGFEYLFLWGSSIFSLITLIGIILLIFGEVLNQFDIDPSTIIGLVHDG